MAELDICAYVPTCNATSRSMRARHLGWPSTTKPIPPRLKDSRDGFSTATSSVTAPLITLPTTHSLSPMQLEGNSHAMSSKVVPAVRCAALKSTPW
jgi:hypothetical protein